MASSSPSSMFESHSFYDRVAEAKCDKNDINALVLDYLIMAGYPRAAALFAKEANFNPRRPDTYIEARDIARKYIHMGKIEDAIRSINEMDSELLDKNPSLHFALLRLQLIELIRECGGEGEGAMTAIAFASEKLAPRAAANSTFLSALEQAMTLLLIPHDKLNESLTHLLDPSLRRDVAAQVSEAILESIVKRPRAALIDFVNLRVYAEQTARSKKINLPERIPLNLETDINESSNNGTLPTYDNTEPMVD